MLRPAKYLIILLMCIVSIFLIAQNPISTELSSYAQTLSFGDSSAATSEFNQYSEPQHVKSEITVGQSPMAVAINPMTNILYVANSDSSTVSVIDGKTSKVSRSIPVIFWPVGIAVNPLTNKIYVINNGGEVSVIDGRTYRTVSLSVSSTRCPQCEVSPNQPIGIAVNPSTNKCTCTMTLV